MFFKSQTKRCIPVERFVNGIREWLCGTLQTVETGAPCYNFSTRVSQFVLGVLVRLWRPRQSRATI